MRQRETLLYTGLAGLVIFLVAFLIYLPVLFAWSNRETTQVDGGEPRPEREWTIIRFNSLMHQAPWLYFKLLALHGHYHGLNVLHETESINGKMMILVPQAYEEEPTTESPSG